METLVKKFEKMGARAKVETIPDVIRRQFWDRRPSVVPLRASLNILRDKIGPFYSIQATESSELIVLDVQPKDRHLLLMIKLDDEENGKTLKNKFLCGHDERDWFIATMPDNRPVSNVLTAKEALKPEIVLDVQNSVQIASKKKNRRRNEAFIRQGEWFFIPAPETNPPKWLILENEPMRRGSGKPHTAEYLYRTGGTTVYVNRDYPNGLSEENFRQRVQAGQISARNFSVRRLDPMVFARGRITHADHKTVLLNGWHRVVPNTEQTIAPGGRLITMGFID